MISKALIGISLRCDHRALPHHVARDRCGQARSRVLLGSPRRRCRVGIVKSAALRAPRPFTLAGSRPSTSRRTGLPRGGPAPRADARAACPTSCDSTPRATRGVRPHRTRPRTRRKRYNQDTVGLLSQIPVRTRDGRMQTCAVSHCSNAHATVPRPTSSLSLLSRPWHRQDGMQRPHCERTRAGKLRCTRRRGPGPRGYSRRHPC